MAKLSLAEFLDSISVASATAQTWEQVIAAGYDTLDKIRALHVSDLASLTLAHGGRIGERADAIVASLNSPRVSALLDHADAWLATTPVAPPTSSDVPTSSAAMSVAGLNVVMTGAGPEPRPALEAKLKAWGARIQSAVSSTTNLLICESFDSQSSKAKKARQLGVRVVGYTDVF